MPKRRRIRGWRNHGKAEWEGEEDDEDTPHECTEEVTPELQQNSQVFDLQHSGERERLARAIWSGGLQLGGEASLRSMNPALTYLLESLTNNTYRAKAPSGENEERNQRHLEAMLFAIVRMQSQFKMTLLCARFSISACRGHLPDALWRMLNAVAPGVLASSKWTDKFIDFANSFRPKPIYAELKGAGACMFDNYARKVKYSSVATTDSSGFLLKMTNSCSMAVPNMLAPPGFDALRCCAYCRANPIIIACHHLSLPT